MSVIFTTVGLTSLGCDVSIKKYRPKSLSAILPTLYSSLSAEPNIMRPP